MRTVQIPFPDIARYEKSRLSAPTGKSEISNLTISKGEQTLYLRNCAGLLDGDFLIVDAFENEDAEIVQIQPGTGAQNVDRTDHSVDLVLPIYNNHTVGAVVMKTPYNKVKVFRGVLPDTNTHMEITGSPFDLRPDNAYTTIYDTAGTTTDYYSYSYYNTGTNTGVTTRTVYAESIYDGVLTTWQLRNWFMFGLDLTDDDGNPFPESMLAFAIRAAVDALERTIGVRLRDYAIVGERQDYFMNEYRDFAFIQLNEYPIIGVDRVSIKYPTSSTMTTFPVEWYAINKQHGQVHLIPTSGSISQILMGTGGDYLNFVWKGWTFLPNMWVIDYHAGFAAGTLPADLQGVVGRMACFYPLNIAGDLVGGIAIASKSIGIDGLSQSINTTSSPENAGYSARLRQYQAELKIEIPRLIAYYKGIRMATC